MRKTIRAIFITAVCFIVVGTAFAIQQMNDVKEHPSCLYCGMDRGKFDQSRMLVTYEDGTVAATCSLHCAALDIALNIDKTPRKMEVADYNTKELIDAEDAVWVLGGDRQGVMSMRAKWAFSGEGDAGAFVKASGGTAISFDEALKAAFEDLYQDTKMIRDKRKKMMEMKGTGKMEQMKPAGH